MRQQVAVIGLGRFGLSAARTLVGRGHEVLGIDRAEEAVQRARDEVTHVLQATVSDATIVRSLGLNEVDTAIVAIGSNVEANVVATALLLESGVPYVVARANSALHGTILARLGAHRIVYPEVASGKEVALTLHAPDVLAHIALGPDAGITTLRAPDEWVGRSLSELRLPERGPLIVLAIQRGDEALAVPGADERIREGDTLAVLDQESKIDALPRHARGRR
jgi:trk/ktr system potassium uptake protein